MLRGSYLVNVLIYLLNYWHWQVVINLFWLWEFGAVIDALKQKFDEATVRDDVKAIVLTGEFF